MPSTEALAFQGGGHGQGSKGQKQRDKQEQKAEKRDDKREKHDDKRDDRRDKRDDKRDDRRDDGRERPGDRRDDGRERPNDRRDDGNVGGAVVDRDGYVRVIRDYGRGDGLPPGLAKRESLPPGLRRQLRERGTLPPGLQKRLVPVPGTLGSRLPAVPAYYTRYFAGDDLIIVDTRTNTIATIVRDVWR